MTQINAASETLQFLSDRTNMPKDAFLALGDEARMRAFTIAKQTNAQILQATLEAVKEHLSAGGTMWNFREKFPEIVKPYTEAGREWHLRLVVEQNMRQAQAVGAYAQRQRQKAAFPYVEYQTGPNPRPSHAALDGKIFGVDDPFLLAHTPPWEHGCNCDLISRTAAQVGKAREADQGRELEEQQVVPGNAKLERLAAQNKMPMAERTGARGGALYPVDVRPPSLKPHDQGDSYSFRPDRLNQRVPLSGLDADVRARLEGELQSVGYSIQGNVAEPPAMPLSRPASAPPTPLKTKPALVRISACKQRIPPVGGGNAASGARAGTGRLGRPQGRIAAPAPQIERVGNAKRRVA